MNSIIIYSEFYHYTVNSIMTYLYLVPEEDLQGLPEEEADMMRLMGFGNFDSTKVSLSVKSKQAAEGSMTVA